MGGVRAAELDVVLHRVMEQIHRLEHHGDVSQQALAGKLPHIVSAHGDRAGIHIIKPGNQIADGTLSGAGGANDGGSGPLGGGKGYIVEHLAAAVAEGHMAQGHIEALRHDLLTSLVNEIGLLQLLQTVQHRVRHRQDVGRIVDGLHTAEDGKGEQGDHQEILEGKGAGQGLPAGGEHQPHGSRPQSKQVQTVPGDKAELIFDADGLVCPAGLPKPLDRNAILAEGLDHRQTVNVLNGRPGQRLLSPVAHRGGAGALAADPPQSKGGHQHTDQRRQRGRRAEKRHTQQDHGHLDIAVHHRIHHFHALELQGAQFGGEGCQNVSQVVFGEVPQGHPLEHIPQLHPLLCRPFRADTLLKPVFPVGEEKPQKNQHHDPAQAQPGKVRRQALLSPGVHNQLSQRPSRQHHRPGGAPGGEEGAHEAQHHSFPVGSGPPHDPSYTVKHLTVPPLRPM